MWVRVLKYLRKGFIYFGRNSGIHGIKHLFHVDGNLLTRSFWSLTLLASSGCLYLMLQPAVERGVDVNLTPDTSYIDWTTTFPAVTLLFWSLTLLASTGCLYLMLQPAVECGVDVNFTPDTSYIDWTTTFPAVTLCEQHNTKTTLRKFTDLYPELVEPLNHNYRRYLTDVLFARGHCTHDQCGPCGAVVSCDVPWRSVIENVHRSCSEMVSDCQYNGLPFPCCEYFRTVDSEHGPCFSFNTLQHKEDLTLFVVNRTTGPGVLKFQLLADAEISVHSTEELSTNNLDAKLKNVVHTYTENRADILFSVVEIVNDRSLTNTDVDVRECRYLHETIDNPFYTYPVYSYGACRLAHSTEETYQHCKCVHPARDVTYKGIYCNYTGINCWNTYENNIKIKAGVDKNAKELCLPSCVESEVTTIYFASRWTPEESGEGVAVQVKMVSLPTLRYQRNLLRDNLDLVVTVGGIVGLFFSASILSLLEVFYLILRPPSTQ